MASKTRTPRQMTVSLSIQINGVVYGVEPIRGIQDLEIVRAWRLENQANGKVYDVAERIDGVQCDCPDYEIRRRGLDAAGCKHVKSLIAVGLIDGGGR